MIKNWSVEYIKSEIGKISFAESDPRMDGFVTWGCKKDLYELLWFIEDQLDNCSKYAFIEDDHIKTREQQQLLKVLGKE
jgi:hypothetical protein